MATQTRTERAIGQAICSAVHPLSEDLAEKMVAYMRLHARPDAEVDDETWYAVGEAYYACAGDVAP